MINERNEIAALLDGKRINKKYTYRSCYLLAKHYKELGYEKIEIRNMIFDWAKKYEIYISDDLNAIIQRAFYDKHKLVDNVEIKVSKEDIDEIFSRFDKHNTRLTAFAMLCFAKKHADKKGMFYMSRIGLSNWIGIDQSHLSNRYVKELIDFGYLDKVSQEEIKFIKRRGKHVSKMLIYKINVKHENLGEFIIYDNDIVKEYSEIVSIYDTNIVCHKIVPQNSANTNNN